MNRNLLRAGALWICLALVIGALGLASPARADVNVSVVIPAPYLVLSSDEKAVEHAVMLAMLAAFFDVDMDVVVVLGKRHSYADVAVILHLNRSSRCPIGYLERMRRRGLGWGQVAHRVGVHPGTFNQRRVWAKKHDAQVAGGYLWGVIGGYYGIPRDRLRALHKKGYPPAQVVMAANVATHARRPVLDVIRYRAGKQPWNGVASHFNVGKPKFKQAAPPKAHHPSAKKGAKGGAPGHGKKGPPAKGKGKGKGKGKP